MSNLQDQIKELRISLADSREKGSALGQKVTDFVTTTGDGIEKLEKRQDWLMIFLIGQLVTGIAWLGGITVKLLWFSRGGG